MKQQVTASIFIAFVLIVGAFLLSRGNAESSKGTANNVSIVNGKQIIEINAKGGYSPAVTAAKAGMSTILKVSTRGTFDCSSALIIPSIGYRSHLPQSGVTEIEIPQQASGSSMQGLCSMGMYNFQIKFN